MSVSGGSRQISPGRPGTQMEGPIMQKTRLTSLIAAAVLFAPLATFAGTPAKSKAHDVHATTGVVKSIDASTLVISRTKKPSEDLSFTLNGSTRKDGSIVVGAPVSVRYENEGKTHVATAVA